MFNEYVKKEYGKQIDQCTDKELYTALVKMTNEMAAGKKKNAGKKKLYYISAEFLIGKLLSNNLINLGIYDEVSSELKKAGKKLSRLEELEPEPSLGNGGLGRLAACFLDSIASLGLPGDGIGLNYHFGLFRQVFKNKLQKEEPNPWMEENGWLIKSDRKYTVSFGKCNVDATLYEILVTGYNNCTNTLHLFDVDSVDEGIVKKGIDFEKDKIQKNLTLFLYPDDSDEAGRLLRVYQQYFMVSCGAQLILSEAEERGSSLHDLHEYVAIQINDTHPSMVIPELIRLLTDKGIDMDEAIDIVTKTCAYTNHTILAEALEKWPIAYLNKVVPQLVPIIEVLDDKVRRKFDDEKVVIIDRNDTVHMAHLDIHYGFSVNGVASLHTDILKKTELHPFYELYPEKFNNKTNGITFRRWLLHCNPRLTALLDETIGRGYRKDAMELTKLLAYQDDPEFLKKLLDVKMENKKELCAYLKETQNLTLNPDSIFDTQIKRLHEYKRQLLNVLHILTLYNDIKDHPEKPVYPQTFIFAAKASAGYYLAKQIISLIVAVSNLVNSDPQVQNKLKVIFIEDYKVSLAEIIIPAADLSEQISVAGKEASGTSNMKLMINGAVTLGTLDGANVEIRERVGDENMFLFGMTADEVQALWQRGYDPRQFLTPELDRVLQMLTSGVLGQRFDDVAASLLTPRFGAADSYMTVADFASYKAAKAHAVEVYQDRTRFAKMSLTNIARAGIFSSDRSVEQYAREIWDL